MSEHEHEPVTRPGPYGVREPKGSGLIAWYVHHAEELSISVNAALVLALDQYRAAHESSEEAGPAASDYRTAQLRRRGRETGDPTIDQHPEERIA